MSFPRERQTLRPRGRLHRQWRPCGLVSPEGEAMLRLVLLVLYLAASWATATDSGGGWDPDGLAAQAPPSTPVADIGGGWDPDGHQ